MDNTATNPNNANANEVYTPTAVKLEYIYIVSQDEIHALDLKMNEILELNITEDITTSNIRGDILIRDKQSYIERLPIIGDEFMHIKFRVPTRDDSNAIALNNLRVYKITERQVTGQDQGISERYRLHFISQETISTFNESISRSFSDQTVESIVNAVWNDYVLPGSDSKKAIEIDSTSGKVNFISPNWTPFKVINWLAENMAVNKNGNADFLFYEATNKAKGSSYCFKSLDSLMKQKPSFSLVFSPQNFTGDKEGYRDKKTSSFNIPEFGYDKSGDVLNNTVRGQYYQYWIFHDILRKKFVVSKLSHEDDFLKTRVTSAASDTTKKFYSKTVKKEAKPLQYIRMPGNVNTFPKKIAKSKGINNDFSTTAEPNPGRKSIDYISSRETTRNLETSDLNAEVCFAREFRLQQINNYKLVIDFVPGTDEIQLGKVIEFSKPSNVYDNAKFREATGRPEDKYITGNYLVTRIDHKIWWDGDRASWRYKMGIDAVKDCFNETISYTDIITND